MKIVDVPLSAIRSFAAAAQWKTLSGAAEELGVTPGAVSRSIGKLEQWLGQELFARQGRRLMLTPAGEFLAARLSSSLADIMSACMDISGMRKRHLVTVEAPTSFAMYWLLPRLTELEEDVGDTEVSLATRMTNQLYDGPLADIVITRGRGIDRRLQGYQRFILMQEEMSLLASPDFLLKNDISCPSDVLIHQKLGTITRPTDWPNWLRAADLADQHIHFKHRFDHLFVALQAVRDGIGTIVGPKNVLGEQHNNLAHFKVAVPAISFSGEFYFVYYRSSLQTKSISHVVEYLSSCIVT